MKLYSHLQPKDAKRIIELANQGISKYKIQQITGISKGKINRCLDLSSHSIIKTNYRIGIPKPQVKTTYKFVQWINIRDQNKVGRAFEYAQNAQTIYLPFINFCKDLFNVKILNVKVKRSADEYIKEFRKAFPAGDCPSRDWVYKMAKSHHYDFKVTWLVHTKQKRFKLKSEDEQLKPMKYNSIDLRPEKTILRQTDGNYEIDSVIGKRSDKTALLTLIDLKTGKRFAKKYDRSMNGFRDSLKVIIKENNLWISTLTMDNGGENNGLWEIVDSSKMFNCHPYCSGEKGTLENSHRLIRRLIPKGVSMDNYSETDIDIVMKFCNSYYSRTFKNL